MVLDGFLGIFPVVLGWVFRDIPGVFSRDTLGGLGLLSRDIPGGFP